MEVWWRRLRFHCHVALLEKIAVCVKHLVVAGVDVVHRWNREAAHFQELGVKVGVIQELRPNIPNIDLIVFWILCATVMKVAS